ncbi:MAG: D-2-hydroxyacid dehydrogenase [Actinomycetales bacterium]|nr:D-2-hydroxyacid dehydrogenase [Actinomycetales bacterium]
MSAGLRVVIATPLSAENVALLREREPRLEVVYEPELLSPADTDWQKPHASWLAHERSAEDQRRYEAMVDSAEALFGVPDHAGAALARTVAANPGLRWVHTIPAGGGQQVRAAGLDRAALERIVFTTSAGVHAEPLAEFAVFGVLAGAKQLPWMLENQRAHTWPPRRVLGLARDTTVAVVGLGGIGRATASRLAALGFRVIGVHRRPVEAEGVAEVRLVSELATVAAEVDALVLCLPDTEATRGLLSAEVLAAVRDLTVVNVGRGTAIDEDALRAALVDGRVGFAALDVVAQEPLPAESPLWDLPNLLISPHTAAISDHEPRLITELFADNARRLLDGEPLRNRVDTVEFY